MLGDISNTMESHYIMGLRYLNYVMQWQAIYGIGKDMKFESHLLPTDVNKMNFFLKLVGPILKQGQTVWFSNFHDLPVSTLKLNSKISWHLWKRRD